MNKIGLFALVLGLVMLAVVQAVSIESVNVDILRPGETGKIIVDIENNFEDTAKNVVFEIDVSGTPFNVVGSSSFGVNKIEEDDDERFAFGIRVSPTAEPGEYQIPYKLSYMIDNEKFSRENAIGVKIVTESIVEFGANAENAVVGERGTVEIKIINKGLGDLRFASVKIFPKGFTLVSDQEVYIGDVDSDDFEVASFDVLFAKQNVDAKVIIEYRDSENILVRENVELPLTVYNRENAFELGIIKKNNSILYVSIAVLIIVLWIVIRAIQKRRRLRNSRGG